MNGLDGFIVTADGYEVSMAAPHDTQLTPLAIAWSLSQINRFTGHALRPYSVAEHSLLVCDIAERELGLDHHGQFGALMHDAHECVAGDMHSPGKHVIGHPWYEWEHQWEHLIRAKFSLHVVMTVHHQAIERADEMALATERRDLMPTVPGAHRPWPRLAGVKPVEWVYLAEHDRCTASWEDWRDRWLDRYHQLVALRNPDAAPTAKEVEA